MGPEKDERRRRPRRQKRECELRLCRSADGGSRCPSCGRSVYKDDEPKKLSPPVDHGI